LKKETNTLLLVALIVGIAFHGSAIFFTLESSYDALIHVFFGDHYADNWFSPWEYRWYTGFNVQSYPPLVHQTIGLLSYIGGLKFGMYAVAFIAIIVFITGIYRYTLLMTGSRRIAGYGSVLAVFSSTFIETLHIFGQLPSILALSILLHAMTEVYLWIKTGKKKYYFTTISMLAVTVTSHHVTPIFGMVFFLAPLIGMAVMDACREKVNTYKEITFKLFWNTTLKHLKRITAFGFSSIFLIFFCILPYWYNSKKNPITQVSIPHGSRDNFLEITSSGLVFFIIPWGIFLFILPYFFYRFFSKRYIFFGISFSMLTLLGTGGTTPIPLWLLGETAFNILTLDRFTLWATIMALPIFAEFSYRLIEGDLKNAFREKFGTVYHRLIGCLIAGGMLFMVIFSMTLGYFRPSQPAKINLLPIVNFLAADAHDSWRYLPLGFGDQMAWLSSQTNAMTVDGNYHSARRLPELTTRAIERIENSKFRGVEGIGSLQQFLTVPEKYHLKYIFSNDKFYDPILYYCGWQRLQQLENGIMVWEKLNVPPIPQIIPKEEVPTSLKLMWGIIPIATLILAFFVNIQLLWIRILKSKKATPHSFLKLQLPYKNFPINVFWFSHAWAFFMLLCLGYGAYEFYIKNTAQHSANNVVEAYYDALDFKEFSKAHALLDPESDVTIAQYMLQVSVTDGILSSYAKMDSLGIDIYEETASNAKAKVTTRWITPLETIYNKEYHELIKHQSKWYIKPSKLDHDIPPDQLFTSNGTTFYNHGRRKISTQETLHEDVLKQPVLEILSAKLVQNKGQYSIIGELQNVDNMPADVVINATLYNNANKELANYNAKYHMKHKLMPKETTTFKINFEGIAWTSAKDHIPPTFNPDQFTPIHLKEVPTNFNIQSAGNTANTDLYKQVALQNLTKTPQGFNGVLFNYGIQEVTIPQLIISYYNEKKELVWVDHSFLKEGVRVQRKHYFKYEPLALDSLKIIYSSLDNCFVNGLPNAAISKKIFPSYIKFEINTYVGNPK